MLQVTKPSAASATTLIKRKQQSDDPVSMPDIITGNEDPPCPSVRNCGCGFIYSREEYEARDQCGFCKRPLSSKNRKENRRRKEEGEDEQGLAKAEALRARLVAYDRESTARTRVNDDDQA